MKQIIDTNVKLSQSKIWQMQQQFYAKQGIHAWVNQVPFYATSNVFIANRYARIINSFIQNWRARHPEMAGQPFYIVELGAGCGQLGFYILKQLQASNIKYIMSDFNPLIIDYWQSHPALAPFLKSKQLDFAVFDLIKDQSFTTVNQKIQFVPNGSECPIICIANYLFDSLPADIFAVDDGQLYSVNIDIKTDQDNIKDGIIVDFEKLEIDYHRHQYEETYYQNTGFNRLLKCYQEKLVDSYFLFPSGALQALETLASLSKSGITLISTDKAYTQLAELDQLNPPELTGHSGCFSLMVNFHAITEYCLGTGNGDCYLPAVRGGVRSVVMSKGLNWQGMEGFRENIKNCIDDFSPADYLNIYRNMRLDHEKWNLETINSHLDLSCWDPEFFNQCYRRILAVLDGANILDVDYLANQLSRVVAYFYGLPHSPDIYFAVAVFFQQLARYQQAIQFYQQSAQHFEPGFGLLFNIGVCFYHTGQHANALAAFEDAYQLRADDPKLLDWLKRLRAHQSNG